ncbi:MAG TPA: hypothetical protein VJV03_15460 [Pyrinomonadaceae bacterium]|nr:hypothetical protein [Pyrinomonadaceae bacterium]
MSDSPKLWNVIVIGSIKVLNKQLFLFMRQQAIAPLLPYTTGPSVQTKSKFGGPGPTSGAMSMTATSVKTFSKKLSCPSSTLLMSFAHGALAREINSLIRHHLDTCDFCYCEIPLLAFYSAPSRGECRVPDLPINLRVLAESILARDRRVDESVVG